MRGFYETKIKYYDEDKQKSIRKLYLTEALSFTEAEANITKYLTDWDIKDFEVLAISKNSYDDLIYRIWDTDYGFYECKANVIHELGAESKHKFLIAGESVEDATKQVIEFVKDSDGKPRITKVNHREIEDLVITKDCKETGTIILGFQEQKEIEQRVEGGNLNKMNIKIFEEIEKEIK